MIFVCCVCYSFDYYQRLSLVHEFLIVFYILIIKNIVLEITCSLLEEFLYKFVIINKFLKSLLNRLKIKYTIIYSNWKNRKKIHNQQSLTESCLNNLILYSVENPWIIANKLKNSHRFSKFVLKEEAHVNQVEIALHAIQY
jgi:hypothetical protein